MTTRQGEFDEVDATESETVQGAIKYKVIVRSGVSLMVQGSVTGDVVIEDGGTLIAQGTFNPDSVDNRGVLAVAGTTDFDPSGAEGHFVVSPNTILTFTNPPSLVQADGHLKALTSAPDGKINIDAGEHLVWDDELGQFTPLGTSDDS